MEDVKPSVGHIPPSEPLRLPSVGRNFFRVELLVGDKHERILPFDQHQKIDQKRLGVDTYVATTGLSFAFKVTLERPGKEGSLYGARVYIDSGDANTDTVYDKWSDDPNDDPKDNPKDNYNDNNDETVDTAKADHFFWFEPGETEHLVKGFYKSATESQMFKFEKPQKKRMRDANVDIEEVLKTVGTVRIAFCSVKKFEDIDPSPSKALQLLPQQVRIDDRLDRKIQIAAKPGAVIKDGRRGTREAVLCNDIIYERRIVYNTFEGFNARRILNKHTHLVDFYKGMPLEALEHKNIRMQGIAAFYLKVSSFRVNKASEERIEHANDIDVVSTISGGDINEDVRVEDIVHYICKSLSPAASYIICTGRAKEGNYGEGSVQKTGAVLEEQLQDYVEKEKGLVAFFMQKPGTYNLELHSVDPDKRPKENFTVKFAVLDLCEEDDAE